MSDGGNGEPSGIVAPGGPTETVRAAVVPRLGGRLGRYELMEVVGHGAMATVFRARDSQLGREVAVKVMTLAVAARAESAERFRREAQAVAAVKHPGIVEIFDFVGPTETEPAYIVSELISGPTLRQFLDGHRGRLLPESAALIAIPIAEALRVAHTRGIIHRDIKPDNVMLDRGGGKCRVVVTDFGVAHITGLETMTATGALVGSPAFMSPEQARGHGVGPASDLWALGVLLYEMATGHLPFPGKDALLVVAAIARGLYKRPSQISGYAGGGLDEICGRCLRVLPAERYPDLGALAADLRGFCRAGGLEPDDRALFDLLTDPERFEAGLRPRVADAAVAQARRHGRRGELGRALSELARATAYVPRHPEAEKLVASISWRRRWIKVVGVAAAATALAGAAVYLGPRLKVWMESTPAESVATVPKERPAIETPPSTVPPGVTAPGQTATRTTAAAVRPVEGKRSRDRRRKVGSNERVVAKAEQPEQIEEKLPEKTPADDAAELVAEPAPPAPAPPPRKVNVAIYAQRAFCNPSLDHFKPQLSPAWYRGMSAVTEGVHDVYCTMPGQGRAHVAKVHVSQPPHGGAYEIRIGKTDRGTPIIVRGGTTGLRQPDPGSPENPAPPSPEPR
jgi:eukaryotic-like serine/threonine-protein kinase